MVTDVKIEEIHEKISKRIDELENKIDEDLQQYKDKPLRSRDCFICKNEYWDLWFQKLFAQLISVKIWIIALITILLYMNKITNTQFATILGVIMGLKGTFQVAQVWKKKTDDMTPMDKT